MRGHVFALLLGTTLSALANEDCDWESGERYLRVYLRKADVDGTCSDWWGANPDPFVKVLIDGIEVSSSVVDSDSTPKWKEWLDVGCVDTADTLYFYVIDDDYAETGEDDSCFSLSTKTWLEDYQTCCKDYYGSFSSCADECQIDGSGDRYVSYRLYVYPPYLPTVAPTWKPTLEPTPKPTPKPTALPIPTPTAVPVPSPTPKPTTLPSPTPTVAPGNPSVVPNPVPTPTPSQPPTSVPSPAPTAVPSPAPSTDPSTVSPSSVPSSLPSLLPTLFPPTSAPTLPPTSVPTGIFTPSSLPTLWPTPTRPAAFTTASMDDTTITMLAAGIGVLIGSWLMYCARKLCKRRVRQRGHRAATSDDWFIEAGAHPTTAVAMQIEGDDGTHVVDAVAVVEMSDFKGGPVLAEATAIGGADAGSNSKNTLDGAMTQNQYDRSRDKIEADERQQATRRHSRSGSSSQGRHAMRRLSQSLSRSLSGGAEDLPDDVSPSYTPMGARAAAEEQWEAPLDDSGGLGAYVESHAVPGTPSPQPRRESNGSHMPFPTIAPPPHLPDVRRPSGAATQADRDLAESTLVLAGDDNERAFAL